MTTEELKYIEIPENNKRYEVAVTQEALNDTLVNYGSAITKSKSGAIATITDGADDVPCKSVKVNIVPKQSGSGDPSPSNVRPISGWDEVEVVRAREYYRLIPNQGFTSATNYGVTLTHLGGGKYSLKGTATSSGAIANVYVTPFVIPSADGRYFKLNNTVGIINLTIRFYNQQGTSIDSWNFDPANKGSSYVAMAGKSLAYFDIYVTNGVTYDMTFMVEFVVMDSDYQSYPITLPSTVYGGELDVVSGKLTIDKALVDMGSLNYTKGYRNVSNTGTTFYVYKTDAKSKGTIISSAFKTVTSIPSWESLNVGECNSATGSYLVFCLDYDNVADFKSAVTGVQLCYELATPTEITLTPTEINTLLGNNNIYSSSGSVEVEYRADSTLVYNELVSLIANM